MQNKEYMGDDEFEELAKLYPELMEKSLEQTIGVGKGWFGIIRTLCRCIYEDVAQAHHHLESAKEYPRDDTGEYLARTEAELAEAIENLPDIHQIKEKYGTLRFYTSFSSDKVDNYILFAERMSGITCEECGSPGQITQSGWIRTLCKQHMPDEDRRIIEKQEGRIPPHIQDDENP